MDQPHRYAIGMLTTVTGDAVEAALIHSDGRDDIRPIGGVNLPCPQTLQWGLLEATQNDLPITELARLEKELTHHFARAAGALRRRHPKEFEQVAAVGIDGHTVRRMPEEGIWLQIGNPWLLSELIGLPVVSDFRRHDIAIGGQGAPLESMYHWALMSEEPRPALMLNLGAVCSLTWLSPANEIIAGDVGPGLELLDEWVQEVAEATDDDEGQVSLRGVVHERAVEYALASPFFKRPLPRSPTRSDFERIDVSGLEPEDGAATICAIIAEAISLAVRQLPEVPESTWVTGRGSRHPLLLKRLRAAIGELRNVGERGLNPDTLEAECFGWLAIRYQRGLPVTTPETTGCRVANCAGVSTARGPWS
ncbi:Anhydro-N-acetylmuramic acid kinase [Posidoniimonas polymericola]|uniref:Anhydro-N-acetylmuramic acid kinase n=1 Tax=Posidoniimonas polymericola TaxID=2528002 RepID=A0A5C5YUC9_9BACT|nr:anhydro-N-acetylmuramic acid kinase [Posidoniimonas polymericola]TWT78386.1 Anhydro-N-acetylmuramic acid kinase [Posidoniimonas polymericola]